MLQNAATPLNFRVRIPISLSSHRRGAFHLSLRPWTTIVGITLAWGTALPQDSLPPGARMKTLDIARIDEPPEIDGVLDESTWLEATLIEDLHQVEPLEYVEPSQPTRIFIYYDDEAEKSTRRR